MKRALTGIAAAAVVLGSVSPMAFAATTTSGLTKAGQLPIVVNGSVLSNPYEMTGKDSGNTTAFFPVYYFNQALAKIGYTATWDGTTHTWAITAPGVTAAPVAGGVGTGNTTITVNGTVVKKINTQAAKDPAASKSAAATTYLPAFYVDEILQALGVNGTFSGQSGLKITGSVTNGAPQLSNLSFSGQLMGSGTSSSPVAQSTGNTVTASTTLTDANGNAINGINVTYTVTVLTGGQPTVTAGSQTLAYTGTGTDSNGKTYYTYSVPTDSTGVANITLGYSGNASYTLQASAPYSSNGVTVTSKTAYVEFGQPGSLLISPVSLTQGYSTPTNATAGLVPVTVTIIPAFAGQSVSNIPVQFTLTPGSGTSNFATSTGSYLAGAGNYTVNTDASGTATVYVNANANATATVSAQATVGGAVETSGTSSLTWQQAGTATQIKNTAGNDVTVGLNTKVTLSGQVQDANGNPVANAQILVTGDDGGDDDVSYVNGSTTTAFPNVGATTNTSLEGVLASSSFGDVVTTDANGNFSVVVTDSEAKAPTIQFWSVQNGYVANIPALWTVDTANSNAVTWSNASSSLNNVYVDTTVSGLVKSGAANDEYNKVTGLSLQSGTGGTIYAGAFAGSTPYTANGWTQYTISGTNHAEIDSVDGVALNGTGGLPNQPSSAIVNVKYTSGSISDVTVDGTDIFSNASFVPPSAGVGVDFVADASAIENDTFTITAGGYSATVQANFVAGQPYEQGNASPVTTSVAPGQTQTVTFTVEDKNGNPIPYGTIPLTTSGLVDADGNGLWISAVNGQQLTSNIPSIGTEPTPVPLFDAHTLTGIYDSVYASGAISASGIKSGVPTVQLYADQNGHVSVTFAAGGVGYWDSTDSTVKGTSSPLTGLTAYFSYNKGTGALVANNTDGGSNDIGTLQY
ncbi:hypothetical protein NZD89_20835 [Alicyclobacillus fastidiosus]|uniref:Big-1 domain-containing protein n=1 Tax=Alicyclobacillus fastidiosus TaxID=392011 RepID=A0ABY6ZD07_9BACL|nr:hypothetical protein [Alicyclobacillus fastidiosus]WAH40722.1 hypothetical protein NZD89_20835 [Alicyclobacillus fastidiosus]GMA62193.1 hypothetical protein GCM10025859_26330 [Alicyclobacillus fastidiosus]